MGCIRYGLQTFLFFILMATSPLCAEKIRVLYILSSYPQVSETYIENEIASLYQEYEIAIISLKEPNTHQEKYFPYVCVDNNIQRIEEIIVNFKPHVMHTHWFFNTPLLEKLAQKYHIPYTVRSHSFDILRTGEQKLRSCCQAANSEWCLRVLCFPAFRRLLIGYGLRSDKVVKCWPVVNYQRFFNAASRTQTKKIVGVGASLPKKDYESFIDLAYRMKDEGIEFNLYLCGHMVARIDAYNRSLGSPVKNITYVLPEEMPQVYRDHDWLVYTADTNINTVGLPMAIAEAQASGIGVCLQELPGRRKEHLDYLGGAGFLFKSIDELPSILRASYPERMRLLGLKHAAKSDIQKHNRLLKEVWDRLGD